MTAELVKALCCWAREQRRRKVRRFVRGLSADELGYIADFLGAFTLEAGHREQTGRGELEVDLARFEHWRCAGLPRMFTREAAGLLEDEEHKMILLLEYLDYCGFERSLDHAAPA